MEDEEDEEDDEDDEDDEDEGTTASAFAPQWNNLMCSLLTNKGASGSLIVVRVIFMVVVVALMALLYFSKATNVDCNKAT